LYRIFILLAGAFLFDEKSTKVVHKPSSQPYSRTPNRPLDIKIYSLQIFRRPFVLLEDKGYFVLSGLEFLTVIKNLRSKLFF
jgi:hypothetical protein